ncbi:TIGR02588 family protein [Sphingomonas sabuli]|uniref:TIGR02588 family protein n=1 Tax=Sphingomonas sabuli TaxID=2764186 RepID=A0A7G9L1K6_9SPHN|nr:TIGR02588 family protein [Sphingomonas sabuli]QNM82505.1 TIGR02588 family protein [Sphingomonas sabuli]
MARKTSSKPRTRAKPGGNRNDVTSAIPVLEWVAAGLGLILILGTFAFLAIEGLRGETSPPLLSVRPVSAERSSDAHLIEIEVENTSDRTAAAVTIEAALKSGERDIETSSATFDYVPGKSTRKGGMLFIRDPRHYRLELRVTGYQNP